MTLAEISDYVLKQVDWWQDLGDGILLTSWTKFTSSPYWSVSIDFRGAKKLGFSPGVGANNLRVYKSSPKVAHLPNGHARYAQPSGQLRGIESLLYERLMEAVE